MTERRNTTTVVASILILGAVLIGVVRTVGQAPTDQPPKEQWEYLAVAGPSTTNFSPTGNPNMRKAPPGFGREGFVLEQHLDKIGAQGWELITVAGPPTDPVYYFKRRK